MQPSARRRLELLLAELYSDDVAQGLAKELVECLPVRASVGGSSVNRCLLITYGDSFRSQGERPLETLRRFLRRYLGSCITTVHILPFFPSSSDDGFAVIDYRLVDHHLGGWEDVGALSSDYELMVDLVINHCSRENLWFADFISGREPGRHYFITLPEESDVSAVTRPRSTPLISPIHTYGGIRHVWNTFSDDQIDLDFSNPDVLREFVDILFFYIERGASLIRLDAVAYLWKRLGTSCINLRETHVVVKVLRLLVDLARPGVQLVTETNVPHDENVSYFGIGDEAHMVYQFSLAPLLLYSYVFGDASYLTTWAARLTPPPAGSTYLNFIASHDGIGLRPLEALVPEDDVARLVARMRDRGAFVTTREVQGGGQMPYEINVGLFPAFGGRPEDLPAYVGAHVLMMSFQGIPALYARSLLASPNNLALVQQTGRTRSINRGHWVMEELEPLLADAASVHAQALARIGRALRCRAEQPAFAPGADQRVFPSPPGAFLMIRESKSQTLLVMASVRGEAQSLPLAGIGLPAGEFVDLLAGRRVRLQDELTLAPYEVLWLQVS
jgi:sucrose phosphorylase